MTWPGIGMSAERWDELMHDDDTDLTISEYKQGWHFCFSEWDGLLIGPGMMEFSCCGCKGPWNE